MSSKEEVYSKMMKFYEKSTLGLDRADVVEAATPFSTGLPAFDAMTDIGGLPQGKMIEFSGKEGSFKTAFCLMMIARAGKENVRSQFYNVEDATDWERMSKFGVNPELTNCPKFFSAEDIWRHLLYAIALSAEHDLYRVIVVDSIAVIRPGALQDRENLRVKMNENVELPKIMTQLTDDIKGGFKVKPFPSFVGGSKKAILRPPPMVSMDDTYKIGDSNVCLIFTNHLKERPGVVYGNPNYTPGGSGKDFNYDFRAEFYKSAPDDKSKDEHGRPIEAKLRIVNTKNRVGLMGGSCKIKFLPQQCKFVSGDLANFIDLAVKHGVIEKKGAWYYCNDFPGERLHGQKAVEDFLNGEGQDLRDAIVDLERQSAAKEEETIVVDNLKEVKAEFEVEATEEIKPDEPELKKGPIALGRRKKRRATFSLDKI